MSILKFIFSFAMLASATELIKTDGFKILDLACSVDGSKLISSTKSMAVDLNGKIVVAGHWDGRNDPCLGDEAVRVLRFNSDGTLDSTFGVGGIVRLEQGIDPDSSVAKVLSLADGKILVSGTQGFSGDMYVARLMPDGSYDKTFGNFGRILISWEQMVYVTDMLILNDSGILLVGYDGLFANIGHSDWALLKLKPDGKRDLSFGDNGKVRLSLSKNYIEGVKRVLEDNQSRLLLTGVADTNPGSGSSATLAVRLLPNGEIDQSFAQSGILRAYSGVRTEPQDLVLLEDGSFLLLNWIVDAIDFEFQVTKYSETGSVDTSFGQNGVFTISLPRESYHCSAKMTQTPSGNILIAGNGDVPNQLFWTERGFVVSITPSGQLDLAFASGGRLDLHFANAIELTDIKLIATGFYLLGNIGEDGGNTSLLLGRLDWAGNPDKTFGK